MVVQERPVHNTLKPIERKVWSLIHLKVRKFRRNPMHCFHLNRKSWSGVLCSKLLILRIWEDLVLQVIRIICSIRQDQTWRSKNFMSNLSISASVHYDDKRKSRFALHDAQWGFVESGREQGRLQEELSMKEKTHIRNMHENGRY